VIEGNSSFSAPGDSGSLIVDNQNRPVALLFAGDDDSTDANSILSAIEALDFSFGPSIAMQDLMATLISLP
jgi:hypothetical protein